MKQTILVSLAASAAFHFFYCFPLIACIAIYLSLGYLTQKIMYITTGIDVYNNPDPENIFFLCIVYLIPFVMLPVIVISDWTEIKDEIKQRYPKFKFPKFRSPVYFDEE